MPIETPAALHALFVHGMGRSPLSGWPMLWHLRRAGMQTGTFGYATSFESFPAIAGRLAARISHLAGQGDYVLIGHSLGGVLIRAALGTLPAGTRQPHRVFLLGSPIGASRLAKLLHDQPLYRLLTRDCGQLLASEQRMQHVPAISAPTTGIFGVRGIAATRGPFAGEANDGVVAVAEISAAWIVDEVRLPVVHTLLPASPLVARAILARLAGINSNS
ncbi:esterase/lipase family protein [Dechloromonas denitrificans]|uniref:esterase/lipase family protein n=1 Tax=Dechloromonas denitrificans TaxID=281362 RepID=UPI001CF80199|nr:hypothetical protein [Dechloromonas denitrificans]UCV03553.1 hypothetical protein KI611_21260 [Dechloromonas denitrificans]UCV07814.1 hypothetical protein KI615_20950 [Dechloromonas denitrificans]